jgi:hypothetical protein
VGLVSEFRFAVGSVRGPQSASWKLWTQGDEAYLLQRGRTAGDQKFSFHHKTGACRWALIDPKRSGSERVLLEWNRDPVPDIGSGRGSLLLSVLFPTNHLSAPRGEIRKKLHWIAPAPAGQAVLVDIIITHETETTIHNIFYEYRVRHLLSFHRLRNGAQHICSIASVVDCGRVEIKIPREPVKPRQVFGELFFPDNDTENTGRPVRMIMMGHKTNPPSVWELGGYEVKPLAVQTVSHRPEPPLCLSPAGGQQDTSSTSLGGRAGA